MSGVAAPVAPFQGVIRLEAVGDDAARAAEEGVAGAAGAGDVGESIDLNGNGPGRNSRKGDQDCTQPTGHNTPPHAIPLRPCTGSLGGAGERFKL